MPKEGDIRFPEEWVGAAWNRAELLQVLTIKATGRRIFLAGGNLDDGTCLYGMAFPGGQRTMRLGPANGWSVEERFKGEPSKHERPTVDSIWRMYVASMIESKHEAEAELGPPPKAPRV